jgi:hypothetical protein
LILHKIDKTYKPNNMRAAQLLVLLLSVIIAVAYGQGCVYDACGVCNGDGSSCDTSGTQWSDAFDVAATTICNIGRPAEETDSENPLFNIDVFSSQVEYSGTFFNFRTCDSSEAAARISAATSTEVTTVSGQDGNFVHYSTQVSLRDLYMCFPSASQNGRLNLDFYVAVTYPKTDDEGNYYSTQCNYRIARDDNSTEIQAMKVTPLGFKVTTREYWWEPVEWVYKVLLKTQVNRIDNNNIDLISPTVLPIGTFLTPNSASSCSESVCERTWTLTVQGEGPPVCVKKSIVSGFTLSTGYQALNGQLVSFTLAIDSCRTETPDEQQLPVPKHAITLHPTIDRVAQAVEFVHGRQVYGKLQILDGDDAPECDTYAVAISKLEMACVSGDGVEFQELYATWHLLYSSNPVWTGPGVYDSSISTDALCKSRNDFEFTARRLYDTDTCFLRTNWKFTTGETVSSLVAMRQHAISGQILTNTTSDRSELHVSCANGTIWDILKGDCIITVTNPPKTKGLGLAACFVFTAIGILLVLAVIIYIVIQCIDSDKKKTYYSIQETRYIHKYN